MSPPLRAAGTTGSTVHSWPNSILPFMEFPLGRNCTVSPFCRRAIYSEAHPISSPFTHSSQQSEQPRINELAVLEEVLAQEALLLEAALFQDTGRRRVVREDMGGDLHQAELLKGVPAHPL